jgi:DNA-binding transcriptional regulator/RsmH inhibitor MraZ
MPELGMNAIKINDRMKRYLEAKGFSEAIIAKGLIRGMNVRCINIFTEQEWNRQEAKVNAMFSSKKSKDFAEKFQAYSEKVNLGTRGYIDIPIPEELQEWIDISDVVLVARSNRIEIWAKSDWEKSLTNFRERCYPGKGINII